MNRILNAKRLILIFSITLHAIVSDNEKPDYYAILGVERAASREDIRRAYHAFAKKNHPDRCRTDDAHHAHRSFTDFKTAYDTLYDEARRKEYDYEPITCAWFCGFVYDLYTFYWQ